MIISERGVAIVNQGFRGIISLIVADLLQKESIIIQETSQIDTNPIVYYHGCNRDSLLQTSLLPTESEH